MIELVFGYGLMIALQLDDAGCRRDLGIQSVTTVRGGRSIRLVFASREDLGKLRKAASNDMYDHPEPSQRRSCSAAVAIIDKYLKQST